MPNPLVTALRLARTFGLPVIPLRAGKLPVGNCPACAGSACGGRPHMKAPGPCTCPAPCHGWAAATTDLAVLTSPAWAPAWREAAAVAYHPAGAGLTVLDLDSLRAVNWARAVLPPTRTVTTPRGQHWIYQGVTRSANNVRSEVDIKSHGAYARWLGPGTGTLAPLPAQVRDLARDEETTPSPRQGAVASSTPAAWSRTEDSGCRHTERYLSTGLERGLAKIRACTQSGAASQTYGVARFLAAQHTHCPGPCDLATLADQLTDAATAVGVPRPYAQRAVTNGLAAGLGHPA
ncbi:DNA primase [Streptacidiphilus carbonis]|uniref:DNA primase n=1 Tax=Streptacidiphilus carbonis TaxID=105422 RepID=UPI0005A9A735|nr:DNA primase [Streptacidiphilus carbonis]